VDQPDCRHLLGDLSAYLDGEASANLCAEIERHMAECENCRVVVDTLRQTVRLYARLPQPGLPEGARERLYKSLNLSELLTPRE
jgi:anti-sigma factor RsiW